MTTLPVTVVAAILIKLVYTCCIVVYLAIQQTLLTSRKQNTDV